MKVFLLLALGIVFVNAENKAIAILTGSPSVTGTITFTETSDGVLITGQIRGLNAGKHGFHIHAKGDLTNGCISTGSHFNPYNKTHGAPTSENRHVGDLGNVVADGTGLANISITDKVIALTGETGILGRAVVVHSGEDDLGLKGDEGSLTTGNAGDRLACGIIGIL